MATSLEEGLNKFDKGDHEKAICLYNRAIEEDPFNPVIYYSMCVYMPRLR